MAKKTATTEVPARLKKRKECEKRARALGLAPIGANAFSLLQKGRK